MTIIQGDATTSSDRSPVEEPSDGATAFDQLINKVRAEFDTQFTWDYERGRDGLNRLYEKAKRSQWNVSDDLDWSIDVDPERMVRLQAEATGIPAGFPARSLLDVKGSPVASWNDDQWVDFAVNSQCASLSQFLHGEQGALLCTARLVESVPWIEAKYYGSTQVVDEARHVEAFARYLDEKMPTSYPINENLKSLLDSVLSDERWDLVYLGMQVVIEGLALAAFGMMLGTTQEPLLKNLLRYVMSDEARHVAFGILSLQEIYADLSADDFRLRQEFAFEACNQMRRRTLNAELWPSYGISNEEIEALLPDQNSQQKFQQLLFSKIVPNCKKLGLLDHRDGWLRERFQEMNIIQFEDWENTAEALDLDGPVADRELDDAANRASFDPDALQGVEVIDTPTH
ncbi:MAG: ferritin-like domain-containing protein [Acidimicrobiaceae bacterium]|jgi:hypothetical protein|nr:ferritin-like domain-containing protein [Acidimicrobiaceae bacterium]